MWGDPEDWPIRITAGDVSGEDGAPRTVFEMGERLTFRFRYKAKNPLQSPNFIVTLVRSDGVICSNYSTEVDGCDTGSISGEGSVELRLPPLKLVAEMYVVNVTVREKGFQEIICDQTVTTMHVRHELLNSHFGVFHERADWLLG
jgi:lipopolysaccharide transport system ATP-binding protein